MTIDEKILLKGLATPAWTRRDVIKWTAAAAVPGVVTLRATEARAAGSWQLQTHQLGSSPLGPAHERYTPGDPSPPPPDKYSVPFSHRWRTQHGVNSDAERAIHNSGPRTVTGQ